MDTQKWLLWLLSSSQGGDGILMWTCVTQKWIQAEWDVEKRIWKAVLIALERIHGGLCSQVIGEGELFSGYGEIKAISVPRLLGHFLRKGVEAGFRTGSNFWDRWIFVVIITFHSQEDFVPTAWTLGSSGLSHQYFGLANMLRALHRN